MVEYIELSGTATDNRHARWKPVCQQTAGRVARVNAIPPLADYLRQVVKESALNHVTD